MLPQPDASSRTALTSASGTDAPVDDVAHIRQILAQTDGNVVQAARLLGLSRSGLRYRMLRYGLGATGGGEAPSRHRRSGPASGSTVHEAQRADCA